jgi:hypothetical protein
MRSLLSSPFSTAARRLAILLGFGLFTVLSAAAPAFGQSMSGFTYNGLNLASYQANEYLNASTEAATSMRATGANYAAVVATQYVQTSTSNVIAPETASSPGYNSNLDPLSPTDAAVVSAIQALQAQGLIVSLKPHVDSIDGVFRGNFAPTNPAAWFASYQTFILHYAQLAVQNNVGMLVIGTELKSLSGSAYLSYWTNIITALRTQYPGLTLVYGANATGAGDEFTTVSFWSQVDIIGVDGYFPLTNQADPTVAQLVAAWTNNKSGFNIVTALKNLQSTYNKPLIFTEIGYVSVAGANETPYAGTSGTYDATEQQNCYEAFFEVFSQQTAWMKGVFWWDWTVSPPGASDQGYSPQNKPAGTVTLPKWFGNTSAGFTIAPSNSTLAVGQGLTATDTISITPQAGFTGAVTLATSALPTGVTGGFSAGSAAGTQVLSLTATGTAPTAGPVTVTVTGTSGAQTATAPIALSVVAASTQTITFTNPGAQKVGAQVSLTASASSGLPVTLTSTTANVCMVNSSTGVASLLTTGTCSITASQAGNATYAAATPVTDNFSVTALTPVPVPAADDVVVSQVNWRASLSGNAYASGNPGGSSFGVNSAGSVAIANTSNLVLFNALTGAATTLGPWGSASALALDASNNIYVGNPYGPVNSIVKLPYVGGATNGGYATFTTPTSSTPTCTSGGTVECVLPSNLGSVNPGAMAFDAAGDLFYITASSGASGGNSIYECNVACIGGTGSPVLVYAEAKAANAPSSTSGQLLAGSLAIDSAGNIFFTDSSIYVNQSSYAITSFYSDLNELPVSTGTGYGGKTTGYAAAPTLLYTLTPTSIGTYDNQLDGVAVQRSASGDTVFFADQNNGIFAFPDTSTGIPIANGQPTGTYQVASQGAKTLAIDGAGNLYLAAYSSALGSGGDTLAQVTVNSVTVPTSPVGTAVSPSSSTAGVTTFLNDTNCSATPKPAVTFAGTSAAATATATAGSCSTTLVGASSFPTTVSFTPSVAGTASITLTGTDQASNTGSVTITGIGTGFTLSPSASTLSVAQGGSSTDTILVADQGGFTGSVTLAATGLPAGVTAAFATNPATSSSVLTLTATSTASIAGPVTVTVTGTSGTLTASTTIAVSVVAPPSFTLAPASSSVAVTQGSSNTDSITVSVANGFTAGVTLTASGLPTGVTAAFSPNPTTTGSSVLTLTAASTAAAAGPVTVTITGTSGTLTQSTTVALTVNAAPSFTLAPSAATLTVVQAASNTDTITVTGANGFTGSVTLAATGLPAGVTAAFATNPTTGSSVLTLTASSTATTGTSTVTITGTSGTLTASTTVALTVSLPPSFTLASFAPTVSVVQGNTNTDTITVTGANGFSGSVTLSATGLPSGVTAAFGTNPATGSSVLTFTAASTAATGTSTITINGTSGTLTASTTFALTVTPGPSFTLAPSASTLTVTQGLTVTDTITVTGANAFAGAVTLAASGLPAGVTASFGTNPVTGSSVLTLSAASTAVAGASTVTITGTSGALTASTTIALTVNLAPNFTLTAAPASLTIPEGLTGTSTITVAPVGGFSGTVALTASGLPTGVTASFAAGSVSGTQVLTLTAANTAAIGGPVTVTIRGTSGTLSASTTVAVTIGAAPGFTIAGNSITVHKGAATGNTSTLTLSSLNAFAGTVALTCAVAPAAANDPATCALNPTSVSLAANGTQNATLSVSTTGTTPSVTLSAKRLISPVAGTAFALMLLFRLPRRRRRWSALLAALFLLVTLGGAIGCSTASSIANPDPGTTSGTYQVTVSGTSGTASATATITLNVQ